jgi:hypothetical protein
MPAKRPRDLLTGDVLGQLHGADLAGGPASTDGTAGADDTGQAALAHDIGVLRDAGYLSVALPGELGGLGCTLRQAACGQRRLAGVAPLTALAVSGHLYWTGAAVDACRSGDASAEWILREAAAGAVFGSGHHAGGRASPAAAEPGADLKFASPDSRCDLGEDGGYTFRNPAVLASLTPGCDWVAVHALTDGVASGDTGGHPSGRTGGRPPGQYCRHDAVLAFAGTGTRCAPALRVVRVLTAGAPSDVFTTSAIGWGCALLASVEFSAARQAFRRAADTASRAAAPTSGPVPTPRQGASSVDPSPLDQWPVAEASLRLDAMKDRIAQVTHPWPRVPEPGPDLGGQHLISVYAMRREITVGATRVRALSAQIEASRNGSGSAVSTR